jgi:predicted RNA binding protein YcfA (HicA-like mRNA interferase family)
VGKLRVLSGQEVCEILERHGFTRVRQRGSHIVMQRVTDGRTTTVPVPNHQELRPGTLRSISASPVCRGVNLKCETSEPSPLAAAAALTEFSHFCRLCIYS